MNACKAIISESTGQGIGHIKEKEHGSNPSTNYNVEEKIEQEVINVEV